MHDLSRLEFDYDAFIRDQIDPQARFDTHPIVENGQRQLRLEKNTPTFEFAAEAASTMTRESGPRSGGSLP